MRKNREREHNIGRKVVIQLCWPTIYGFGQCNGDRVIRGILLLSFKKVLWNTALLLTNPPALERRIVLPNSYLVSLTLRTPYNSFRRGLDCQFGEMIHKKKQFRSRLVLNLSTCLIKCRRIGERRRNDSVISLIPQISRHFQQASDLSLRDKRLPRRVSVEDGKWNSQRRDKCRLLAAILAYFSDVLANAFVF